MTNDKKLLEEFNVVCDKLTDRFVTRYFGSVDVGDYWWISDEKAGVLCVADYFFDLDFILTSLKYNATRKQLFEYYDEKLKRDMVDKPMSVNYKNFIKYGYPENWDK